MISQQSCSLSLIRPWSVHGLMSSVKACHLSTVLLWTVRGLGVNGSIRRMSMICQMSMICPSYVHGLSVIFPLSVFHMSTVCLSYDHGPSSYVHGPSSYVHGLSVVRPWSVICPWSVRRMSMVRHMSMVCPSYPTPSPVYTAQSTCHLCWQHQSVVPLATLAATCK